MITLAKKEDAYRICEIYNHYVINSSYTFEEEAVGLEEMENRIEKSLLFLLVKEEDHVMGYAYASKWRGRPAYRYTAEVTVYLAPEATGRGLGRALYEHLIKDLKDLGYHSLISVITLPNEASEGLHKSLGFTPQGFFPEVGYKFQKWIDVKFYQKQL